MYACMNFIRHAGGSPFFRLKLFPRRDAEECKFSGNSFNSQDYKIDPNSNSHACVTPVANLNLPLCERGTVSLLPASDGKRGVNARKKDKKDKERTKRERERSFSLSLSLSLSRSGGKGTVTSVQTA